MSIATNVKETVTEPIHWIRRYPWAAGLFALAVLVIAVRKSDTIRTKIALSAKGGSTIGKGLAGLFGVSYSTATA